MEIETALKICKSCAKIVAEGIKKCICGGMIFATLVLHIPDPHTHLEQYQPKPIQTITMVQTSTTSGFGR